MAKFDELIKGDKPVLVDFFATWCGPCRAMHPILEEIKKQVGDRSRIIKIDIDAPANRKIVETYNVRSVPTLIIFRNGIVIWRGAGVTPADQLIQHLSLTDPQDI